MAPKMKSLTKRVIKPKIKPKTKLRPKLASQKQPMLFRRKSDLPWKSSGSATLLEIPAAQKTEPLLFRRKTDMDRLNDLGDSELITVILNQNREAYKELFSRYQKKLFTYVCHLVGNKEETEDILQNVFSKTYKSIEHFDTSRKFSSWIYRIAHNEAVNFLKRKSKRYMVSWEDVTTSKDKLDTATNEEPPEEKWAHQEITKEIDDAMERLPKKYQQVLKLRYFQEHSYEDISEILGKPVNTVGTLINRAKKKLLEVVKEQGVKK